MTAFEDTQHATKSHSCVLRASLFNALGNENDSLELNVMEPFTGVMLMCILYAVNGSLRRYALHHPEAQNVQMAHAATQWLIWVVIFWWVAVLTPEMADRYLPDDVLIEVDRQHTSNETTTEFLLPLLPSWRDKK